MEAHLIGEGLVRSDIEDVGVAGSHSWSIPSVEEIAITFVLSPKPVSLAQAVEEAARHYELADK